jgi:hypothetical protein
MAMLKEHALLHVQTEARMHDVRTRLAHNAADSAMGLQPTEVVRALWVELSMKTVAIDKKLRFLISNQQPLIDSVVQFNTLILGCGEEYREYLIAFDEQLTKMFEDAHQRLLHELNRNPVRRPINSPSFRY